MFRNDVILFHFTGPFGIRVEVGKSLLFLLGLILYLNLRGSLLHGGILAVMLVLSIFLHELGHAWGAHVQGIPVRRIVLHGGGGFCEHERASNFKQEEFIVAMGPIVNLTLWAIAGLVLYQMTNSVGVTPDGFIMPGAYFFQILYYINLFALINLALFVFNLIPAQPLDGGKLVHLGLRRFLPADSAQRATGAIGLLFSILWIPAMIWVFVTYGLILFYVPSIKAHYKMMKGELSF